MRAPTAALCLLGCTRPETIESGPVVVVFTIDTVRVDRFDLATTPALDTLAAAGRRFTQATTPLTRTTPALASLHTGLDPRGHGSWEVGAPMTGTTLAEVYHQHGYTTLGLTGSPVVGEAQGFHRGFDTFRVEPDPSAADLVDRAIDLLHGVSAGEPVFLWIHTVDPHFPYVAPEVHAPACEALARRAVKRPRKRWQVYANTGDRSAQALTDCQALYDAELTAVDSAFATLRSALSLRDDTLWVVTSDHGENMGEGGLWYEHGPDAHEVTLRVPLLLAGPGIPIGEDTGVARLQDIAPTLAEASGLPWPSHAHSGTSLLGSHRPSVAVGVSASALHAGLTTQLRSGRAHKRSCVNDVVQYNDAPPPSGLSLCTDGLFDAAADPTLRTPAQSPDPAAVARLEAAAVRFPAEQARQWVARKWPLRLEATPTVHGWHTTIERLDGEPIPVSEVAAQQLQDALSQATLGAPIPSPHHTPEAAPEPVTSEQESSLRALGYIE